MSYETSLLTLMAGNLWQWLVICLLFGYVLGSIPFGLILTRAAGLGDVRKIGSGNIGATNVLRTGSKWLALATLLLDALKGTAAVLLADDRFGHGGAAFAAFGAFIGHLYPVWLGFRGGKGVATYIGVLLGLFPTGAAAFCGTWLVAAIVTRYSSLGALASALVTPVVLFMLKQNVLAVLTLTMTLLLFWKHRGNISRLVRGAEPKIGARA